MNINKDIKDKIQKMQKILDDMLMKMKIVVSFPLLLKRNKLEGLLKFNEMHILREILYYYKNTSCNIKEVKDYFEEPDNFEMSYKLPYIIEILKNNPEVHHLANDYVSNEKSALEFISAIELYKKFVEEQMKMSPKMKRDRDIKLHSSISSLKSIEIEMDFLNIQLKERKSEHAIYKKNLTQEILSYESMIESKELEHKEELRKIVVSSETEMIETSKRMEIQKIHLDKQIQLQEEEYKKSEEENLRKENALRKLCADAEQKHLDAIAVYDKGIGEKHNLKLILEDELNDLIKEHSILQENFMLQEEQYQELKEEREMIILQIFTARMENFEKNRAARIIQRTWKAHRERMVLRKKKKSKKRL